MTDMEMRLQALKLAMQIASDSDLTFTAKSIVETAVNIDIFLRTGEVK